MSFPKEGNEFPRAGRRRSGRTVATEIAGALRRELGNTHAAVKTAAQWTGASERAAKNWLAGRYAPSGEHLVALTERSEEVLFALLVLARRKEVASVVAAADVRERLRRALAALDEMP
ncbi:hypothetical protein [Methylorubrum thiocyanatum]|uniref:XRE family transcriptional regulator n=1 Tax=Methylorubrum thiocyanatum TaxID=47958 RepID=A0AA40S512_9HYPH|nr:hypothetical protein [Methylorubrum thiocyanatum]MBA8914706.1 hypothetical protein [Methylorubrum thiocyanatum]GJE79119.1 hypothetical protein CJNNKLLH_0445 [Methylorubrum thiocyanatum]